MAKRIPVMRRKREEEPNVPLWFSDSARRFMISVVGGPGDTRMRISTPKGRKEVGFPFACGGSTSPLPYWTRCIQKSEREFRESAVRQLNEMNYNAKLEGKKIGITEK